MAGAMHQAVIRAKSVDRTIDASKASARDNRLQEEQEREKVTQRHRDRKVAQLWLPQADDLEELYGPDIEGSAYAPA
jgi:hypothetical protein